MSVGVVESENNVVGTDDELDDAGAVKTDRTVTFAPYVAIARQTRRLSVSGRAAVKYRDTQSDPDAAVEPDARLQGTATLVDKRLWLDTAGRVSRRLAGSSVIDDALTRPDAATEVYEFAIGPRWEQQLSRNAKAGGSYRYSTVHGSGSTFQGSDAHAVNLGLARPVSRGRALAELRYEGQRNYFDTGDTASSEALLAGVSYKFRSNLSGRLVAGWDRLETGTGAFDENSVVYGAGVSWQPLRHLYIDAEYQERVFGSKPSVSIGLAGRISIIELSWSRTANTVQGVGFGNVIDFATDTDSNAADPPPDTNPDPLFTDDDQPATFAPFVSESDSVTEEIALRYQLRGRVSSFEARLSHLEQEQLSASGRSTANKARLTLSSALSRSSQVSFSVSATDGKSESGEGSERELRSQQALLTFLIQL